MRLAEKTGTQTYATVGERALRFVAMTQPLTTSVEELHGSIAGSWPIYGHYLRLKCPNWAAKFFVDAVLRWQSQRSMNCGASGDSAAGKVSATYDCMASPE